MFGPSFVPGLIAATPKDYASHVTVHGYSGGPLTCTGYDAEQGEWRVRPGGSDAFVLGPVNNVSEGRATYRTDSGYEITVKFKCCKEGNSCTTTPEGVALIQFNDTGAPLHANVIITARQ